MTRFTTSLVRTFALAVLTLVATAPPARAGNGSSATPAGIPEVDPTAMSAALTLLAGGTLILTDRGHRHGPPAR